MEESHTRWGRQSNTSITSCRGDDNRHHDWIRRTEWQWELHGMVNLSVDVLECMGLTAHVHVFRVKKIFFLVNSPVERELTKFFVREYLVITSVAQHLICPTSLVSYFLSIFLLFAVWAVLQ